MNQLSGEIAGILAITVIVITPLQYDHCAHCKEIIDGSSQVWMD